MAHVDKYSRQELRRILKETYREYDDPSKYENAVDISRSHLNYNMNESIHGSYDFMNTLDDRVEDIINNEMDGKPPRNMPKFGSWVITCPRELTVEATGSDMPARTFFEEVWSFCCQRYGEKNVIDGVVHMDETTPHMTVYIVPECTSRKSGKHTISAATVFQRQELQAFHADLDKRCEQVFGRKHLVTRSEEEKAENPYSQKMLDFKQGRQADEAAMDAFQLIVEEAAEQGNSIIQEAKKKAAEMIKNAGEKAKAFEEKQMNEATEKIDTANDKLNELRKEAIRIKEEVERGFGSIEDEMILSMVEETGQRDELILKYKRRFPEQLHQDTERVKRAKAVAVERTRDLHSFDDIIRIRPINSMGQGIELWDDDYDPLNVAISKRHSEQSDYEVG